MLIKHSIQRGSEKALKSTYISWSNFLDFGSINLTQMPTQQPQGIQSYQILHVVIFKKKKSHKKNPKNKNKTNHAKNFWGTQHIYIMALRLATTGPVNRMVNWTCTCSIADVFFLHSEWFAGSIKWSSCEGVVSYADDIGTYRMHVTSPVADHMKDCRRQWKENSSKCKPRGLTILLKQSNLIPFLIARFPLSRTALFYSSLFNISWLLIIDQKIKSWIQKVEIKQQKRMTWKRSFPHSTAGTLLYSAWRTELHSSCLFLRGFKKLMMESSRLPNKKKKFASSFNQNM